MNLRYYLRGLGIGIFVTALIMGVSVKSHPQKMSESEIRAEAAKLGMVDGTTVLQQATTEQDEESDMETAEESEEDEHTVSVNDVTTEEQTEIDDSSEELESETQSSDVKETNENEEEEKVDESQAEEESNVDEAQASDETNSNEEQDASDTNTDEEPSEDKEAEEQPDENKQGTDSVETAKQAVTVTIYPGEGSLTVSRRLEGLGVVENAMVFDKFLCRNGYDTRIRVGSFSIPVEASNEEIAKIITSR
mgnify:CR=1 FL=1